jgi:hypothetical protein
MPDKIRISTQEQTAPSFNTAKDWLTLLLGGFAETSN